LFLDRTSFVLKQGGKKNYLTFGENQREKEVAISSRDRVHQSEIKFLKKRKREEDTVSLNSDPSYATKVDG
jgi:hypothetical protein